MNKVLRCIILSSLFVMSMVASVLAAPYDPPVAIATPPIDRALLAAYGEAAHGADIRFTIKVYVSDGDVEGVSSSGASARVAYPHLTLPTYREVLYSDVSSV